MAPADESESCSGCNTFSPCVEQGLCLDPTVLRWAGAGPDASVTSATPEGAAGGARGGGGAGGSSLQGFLIEAGQFVRATARTRSTRMR